VFFISKFGSLLIVVLFFLDDSPASEFYLPIFWNSLSIPVA